MILNSISTAASLAVQHYPATGSSALQEPIVLLHGWGCDSETWAPLLTDLREFAEILTIDLPGFGRSNMIHKFDAENVLGMLEDALPAKSILMGWSLGGMLAVALTARIPHKISRVITLAANVKFVASNDYSSAMTKAVNQAFNESFSGGAKKTLHLFNGLLAQGDSNERALLKSLRKVQRDTHTNSNWQDALQVLSSLDNRLNFSQLTQPGLHLLAEKDALVPASAASALTELNPLQTVSVITGAAHALHWSQPNKVIQSIQDFLNPMALDKRKVAQSFSRAAGSYDSVANLQRDVGGKLLQHLPEKNDAITILDLGSGTGFFSKKIQSEFPSSSIVALDIAQGMLQFSRAQHGESALWLCGDAEKLPLRTNSIDLIFSNLAIQWCTNLPALFSELRRVLKPGGKLVTSTLGPHTLRELKAAWSNVDGYVHVNHFQSASDIQKVLTSNDFHQERWQSEDRVLYYDKLVGLTRELKALGAHNINRGQLDGLTGRHKVEALKSAYEKFRDEKGLPATYEVFYVVATVDKS